MVMRDNKGGPFTDLKKREEKKSECYWLSGICKECNIQELANTNSQAR